MRMCEHCGYRIREKGQYETPDIVCPKCGKELGEIKEDIKNKTHQNLLITDDSIIQIN